MSAAMLVPWAIEALIASAVLMIAVLALRAPVRRAFGPDIAYALWALPVLRLVLPPLPPGWRDIAVAPVSRAGETITTYMTGSIDAASAVPAVHHAAIAPIAFGPILLALWAAGAGAFAVWHMLAHLRFCRRMLDGGAATELAGGVRVIETDAATGPLAFGIWRRYVAFPRDFADRYDAEERDLALAHELGHHARGDLIANWIALFVLSLHWFNPIAWRAFRAFRADQEIANDARVLAGRGVIDRHLYACAIVKAAHGGSVSAACHLHTIHDLKRRLTMLTTIRTSKARLIGGGAAIGLITLAGLGITASGTAAAENVRAGVERATGVHLASLAPAAGLAAAQTAPADGETDLPPPPVPPAPPAPPAVDPAFHGSIHTETVDGKVVRSHVARFEDGKVATHDVMADLPEVTSEDCAGDPKQMVVNAAEGGKNRIVICSNHIAAAARQGAAMAANGADIERNAYRAALASLATAREKVANDASLAAGERDEATKAIDESITEIRNDMAQPD